MVKEERVKDIQNEKKYGPVSTKTYEELELMGKQATIDRSYDHKTSVGLSEVLNFNMSRQEESFAKELEPMVYGSKEEVVSPTVTKKPSISNTDVQKLLKPRIQHDHGHPEDCGCVITPAELRKA